MVFVYSSVPVHSAKSGQLLGFLGHCADNNLAETVSVIRSGLFVKYVSAHNKNIVRTCSGEGCGVEWLIYSIVI